MLNQELTDYVKKCLEQGIGKEEIRKTLIQTGWQVGEVEAILSSFSGSQIKKSNLKLILSLGVLVLILAGGGFYWFFSSSKTNQVNNQPAISDVKSSTADLKDEIPTTIELFAEYKAELSKKGNSEFNTSTVATIKEQFINTERAKLISRISACGLIGDQKVISTSSVNMRDTLDKPSGWRYFDRLDVVFKDEDSGYVYARYYMNGNASNGEYDPYCLYRSKNNVTIRIASSSTWELVDSLDTYDVYNRALNKYLFCRDLPGVATMKDGEFNAPVLLLDVNERSGDEIFSVVRGGCMYKSVDGGETWRGIPPAMTYENYVRLSGVMESASPRRISINPKNLENIFISERRTRQNLDISDIFESVDGGISFSEYPHSRDFAVNPKTGSFYKVEMGGGADSKGNFSVNFATVRSEGSDKDWKQVYKSENCCGSYTSYQFENNIYFDRVLDSDIYVNGIDGLIHSGDDGRTWVKILNQKDVPLAISVFSGTIFGFNLDADKNLVFLSSNNKGKTWKRSSHPEFGKDNYSPNSLLAVDEKTVLLYFNEKLLISNDGGVSWKKFEPYSTEIGNKWVLDLDYYEPTKTVFIGTTSGLVKATLFVGVASSSSYFGQSQGAKEKRDEQRIKDLADYKAGISLFLADVMNPPQLCSSVSALYSSKKVLLPSGWVEGSGVGSRKIDGTGWIPINFTKISYGPPFKQLSIDPINDTRSKLFYTFACDPKKFTFEINVRMESLKYIKSSAEDGGDDPGVYEVGIDPGLKLIPKGFWDNSF